MYLNIDIDNQKSSLFLDLLNLLKKDHMINDFEVIGSDAKLSKEEQEILYDISQIPQAINDADEGYGVKKERKLSL